MAITTPIKSKSTLKKAFKWLDKNADEAFSLIYRLGSTSGLRITDLTELRWDNINWSEKTITLEENKGTRGNRSRARLKVLEAWHKRLYMLERNDRELLDTLFLTKAKDLLQVIPERYKAMIEDEIKVAVSNAKPKTRTIDLHPSLIPTLKARQAKYQAIDDGFIFARSTIRSNRAKNIGGVVTRQSCWAVFHKMGEAISDQLEKVKGSCHSMRKSFARMLYLDNGRDMNLVLQVMGWSDVKMVMRYLGFDTEQRQQASGNVFNSIQFM